MTKILTPITSGGTAPKVDRTLVEVLFDLAFDVRQEIGRTLDEPRVAAAWCELAHDLDAILTDEIRKGRAAREKARTP